MDFAMTADQEAEFRRLVPSAAAVVGRMRRRGYFHWPSLYDEGDATRDALLSIVNVVRTFDRDKASGRPIDNYCTWKMKHAILDGMRTAVGRRGGLRYKARKRTVPIPVGRGDDDAPAFVHLSYHDAGLDAVDDRDSARRAMRLFNSHERHLLWRHYYDGATNAAIAAELGVSESRVSQLITAMVKEAA